MSATMIEHADPRCEDCGDTLDEDKAGLCYDCRQIREREVEETEYWKEVNRTAWLTSSRNEELRSIRDSQIPLVEAIDKGSV